MSIDYKTLLQKAANYCAIQERCRSELRKKLSSWEATKEEAEKVILDLENQGFLDEKRFANTFARSKFNQLGWGKIKIKMYLKQFGINPTLIGSAMQEISEDAYQALIAKLTEKHLATSKSKNDFEQKANAYRFLVSRGFEPHLAKKAVDLD